MGEDRRRLFATLKIAKSAPVFGGGARPMALYKTSRHQDLYLPTALLAWKAFSAHGRWQGSAPQRVSTGVRIGWPQRQHFRGFSEFSDKSPFNETPTEKPEPAVSVGFSFLFSFSP